jgi:cobalt-zinc-cadmium efflux system membrane fusion protein
MNNQQKIIVAAIAAITIAAGTAVWMFGGTASNTPSHSEAEGHDDKEHHNEAPAKPEAGKEGQAQATAEEKASAGGDGHGDHGDHGEEGEEEVVKLTDEQIKQSRIKVEKAQAGTVMSGAEFQGEVKFDADRTAQVVPRVAGVVELVKADLGQRVKKGEVLAVISSPDLSAQRAALLAARERASAARATYQREKSLWEQKISAQQDYLIAQQQLREAEIEQRNAEQRLSALGAGTTASAEGLSRFEIRAPFDGTVVEKAIALGETVASDAKIFVISDMSKVWVEFYVPAKDIEKVQVGATASVKATGSDQVVTGTVNYVGSLLGATTRTATARITMTNPAGAWRPGLFVAVNVLSERSQVPLVIRNDALQTVEDKLSVFVRTSEGFKAQVVKLGRSDGTYSEVLTGLAAGADYATENSFILKAELGKGSAEHGH